ncbi:unnamed protein product, partial [Brassica oleracea var. botrytis]
VKEARYVERYAPFTRHASQPSQLNCLRLYAAVASPCKPVFVGAWKQTSSNKSITVLHRTVFTPASSIDHRDLHRL